MNKENLIYNLWYRQPDWYSWSKAFLVSLFLHLGILLIALTFNTISPVSAPLPMVYNVELVSGLEVPGLTTAGRTKGTDVSTKTKKTKPKARVTHKSIPIWRVKAKSSIAGKPTIEKTQVEVPLAKTAESSNMVDRELEKLTSAVAGENSIKANAPGQDTGVKKTTTGAEGTSGKPAGASAGGTPGTSRKGETLSLARSAYYTEVWDRIRREWALPDELLKQKGNLAAIIVIRIRRDGKILDAKFEKRSGDKVFDNSVWRAIWKADPLPPFPQIYSAEVDELGIRFRLAELLN